MNCRLATKSDLPALEKMYDQIVENMNSQNIRIWHQYYPFDEFEIDIDNGNLFVMENTDEIVCAFSVTNTNSASSCFEWSNPDDKAVYLSRLGVNVNYLKQGIASLALEQLKRIAIKRDAKAIRLMVAVENTPATNLYLKKGFKQVTGTSEEFAECLNKTIVEYGYEFLMNHSPEMTNFLKEMIALEDSKPNEENTLVKGKNPILLTSIHSMEQTKTKLAKPAETFTREFVLYLAKKHNISCLIKNIDTGFDPNRNDDDNFKTILNDFINKHDIKLVLDLHGAKLEREFDAELGTMNNLSADFSTIMELKEAFEENGLPKVELNNPFKGGKLTQSAFFATNAEIIQIESNYKYRNIDHPELMFRFLNCLDIFIEQYLSVYKK